MASNRIRVDYQRLKRAAGQFGEQADAANTTLRGLQQKVQTLRGGDWVGEGARRFYKEMDQDVFPSLKRLVEALQAAQRAAAQIAQILKIAEDDAAALFRAGGGGMAAGVFAAAAMGGGGILSQVGDFFGGAWDEARDMVGGLWHAVTNPAGTLKGLAYGILHPGELWDAFKKPYVEAWESGHPWRAIGRGALFAGSFFIGAGELGGAGKAGEAAGVAGKAGEVAEVGRVSEVAEVARASELAEAAGTAGKTAKAAEGASAALRGAEESSELSQALSRAAQVPHQGPPYLMPEGFQLGQVGVPAGATPQVVGQAIEAPIRDMVAQHYGFQISGKPASATGPDIVVPAADRARVGFDIADIKPLNERGVRKFWDQLDSWRDNGWAGGPRGTGPGNPAVKNGRAAMFGYDQNGNVYLYGIYDM